MMQPARLVLCEGLPGAGKSTTAHLMSLHMARHGRPARWYFEFHTPHPVFHHPDILTAMQTGEVKPGLFESGLDHWRTMATSIAETGESVFIESAFFQLPVHPMRLMDWPDDRIEHYVADAMAAIRAASPLLVLLRHEDIPRALETANALRGEWFPGFLETTVTTSAYGRARGLTGADGVRQYFTAYRDLIDRLVASSGIETLRLDVPSMTRPQLLGTVASALDLAADVRFDTPVPLDLFPGKYHPTDGDGEFHVLTDGPHLKLNDETQARLIHREATTFEIAGLPITLRFIPGADGRMASIDCTGPLPDLARTWVRAA